MNQCNFIGRAGSDPQPIGSSGVRFSLAVDDYNSSTKQQETTWIPLVSFGKTAETIAKYVTKGRLVRVTTRFNIREYEHQGEKRKDSSFFITDLELLPDGKGKAATSGDPSPLGGDPPLW